MRKSEVSGDHAASLNDGSMDDSHDPNFDLHPPTDKLHPDFRQDAMTSPFSAGENSGQGFLSISTKRGYEGRFLASQGTGGPSWTATPSAPGLPQAGWAGGSLPYPKRQPQLVTPSELAAFKESQGIAMSPE